MLTIAIDARMARHGGIGTYVRHLVSALAASDALEHGCVLGAPAGAVVAHARLCHQPYRAAIYSVAEQLRTPRNVHHAALWHSPHFNIPLGRRGPLVVTVHDLIHLKRPRETRSRFAPLAARVLLGQVARRARAIIVPSEATKRDLCAWVRLDPARITVIPHGVPQDAQQPMDRDTAARMLQPYGVHPPFLLWVSAIRPHKNPLMVLRAFAQLKAKHQIPHQLVMVGQCPAWYDEPFREARRLALGDAVRWVGEVPAGHLPAFYHSAEAFVMPSYEEGFGFPVLEAMATGLPVLVSSAGSLPELVGDAGVIISPDDVDGWVQGLYNILFHEDLRRTLQARSRQRAQHFTWERSIAQHLDVYRAALH